jgi:hypothetical protein
LIGIDVLPVQMIVGKVLYLRPCPLMASVTMGIDAAVTANTNSSNTATREINAAPNFFRVQVFGALKIPNLQRRGRSSSASASFVVFPPASFSRAIASKCSHVLRRPASTPLWPRSFSQL